MAMRDDCWDPDPEPDPDADSDDRERHVADAEEARIYDILRRALSSSPEDARAREQEELRGWLYPAREPALTLATYRRMIEHMTHRQGFASGQITVPARFAPHLIMQTTSAGFHVTGQRTARAVPPMVRVTIEAQP